MKWINQRHLGHAVLLPALLTSSQSAASATSPARKAAFTGGILI